MHSVKQLEATYKSVDYKLSAPSTGIGMLFYTLLGLIGLIMGFFKIDAIRRKQFGRYITASVFFLVIIVFVIGTMSTLNAYGIIDMNLSDYILRYMLLSMM